MTDREAEKIVQAYGGAIARGTFRRLSWLPCSKPKIKQAYFTYIPAIIDAHGYLPDEIGRPLVQCYAMMNMFISDQAADRLESIKALIDAKKLNSELPKHKKLYDEFFTYMNGVEQKDGTRKGGMMDGDLWDEINDFIAECQNKKTFSYSSD